MTSGNTFTNLCKENNPLNKVHLLWTCYGLQRAAVRSAGREQGPERWRLWWMWDSWRTVSLLSIIITQRDGSPPTVVIEPSHCLLCRVVPYGRAHQRSIWHGRERRQTGLRQDTCMCAQQRAMAVFTFLRLLLWSITALCRETYFPWSNTLKCTFKLTLLKSFCHIKDTQVRDSCKRCKETTHLSSNKYVWELKESYHLACWTRNAPWWREMLLY